MFFLVEFSKCLRDHLYFMSQFDDVAESTTFGVGAK